MSSKGAFIDACEALVKKDMEEKSKVVQFIIDNPDKFPYITGSELFELIFGDYQKFADKWKNIR